MNGGTIKFVGLSNRRTIELSDYRTVGPSNRRTIELSDISDHDASIIFIECHKFQTRSFQREVWLYERTDHEMFSSKLDAVDWNALLSDLDDVDEMCNTFTQTFLRVARECIPTKIFTIRNSDRPWFNSELRREIRKRDYS